jgi:thimet oligopeptidase
MLARASLLSLCVLFTASDATAQEMPKSQPPIWASKPDISAFEATENAHLASAQAAIDKLLAVKGPRTVENTLAPYDNAVSHIDSASNLSGIMQQVHPETAFRDSATAMTTKVSSAQTALSLNRDVYHALSSIDLAKADAATKYYVQRQLLEFRLAGVDKDDATRAQLRKLQDELTDAQSHFGRNIADGQIVVDFDSAAALDGLPADYITSHKSGPDGKIHITTSYPDIFPILDYATNRETVRKMWVAYSSRAYPKNRDVLLAMMKTRYQIATINGYKSWPDYDTADRMIATGPNIAAFIDQVDAALRPTAQREYALLLAEKKKTEPNATELYSFESFHLRELVRRSQYNFDSQSVRPYLPYAEVKQGVFNTAAALFHVSFKQEADAPAWAPGVETWDVIDNGKAIGRMYLDMHPRKGKYSHNEMAPILDGIRGKQLPEAALVCNFPAPTPDDPGLMDINDATTFFHEFGHMMHHILGGNQQWAGVSGISMERDFIEAPSQMLEEWMHSPQVLATFAKHYKTGEPIPAELVKRMNRANAFGRASAAQLQLMYSAISYDMYKGNPDTIDPDHVILPDNDRYTLYKIIPTDAHFYCSFDHLSGYSSAYYTYVWDKVIAEDFFQQFDQNNLLAGPTPMRYRSVVLEPGGSMSANDLVKNFLGRPQNMDAFKKWASQEFNETP